MRARSLEAELMVLHQMLHWATTVRTRGDARLLKRNPLAGVRRIREKNPRRPVASWERFEATCKAMQQLGAVGGWVFAGERKPERPMDRHLFDKWLRVAEEKAELPKLEGGLWHPYPRKWVTERRHLSPKDVAAAGGWRDVGTLLECHTQPENETLLAVMAEERKVHEIALAR